MLDGKPSGPNHEEDQSFSGNDATEPGKFDEYEGKDFTKLKAWGAVRDPRTGEVVNFYQDPEIQKDIFGNKIIEYLEGQGYGKDDFFEVVDGGGGDGALTQLLIQILVEAGYTNFNLVNIDIGSNLSNAETNKQKSEDGIKTHWQNIRADLANMGSVEDNHYPVFVSRFVMQYATGRYGGELSDRERTGQLDHLKEMYRVLKPEGMALVAYSGANNATESYFLQLINSEILAKLGAGQGDTAQERFFENNQSRGLSDIQYFQETAEAAGFSVEEIRNLEEYEFGTSAEAYFDRFAEANNQKHKDEPDFTPMTLDGVTEVVASTIHKYSDICREIYGLDLKIDAKTGALIHPVILATLKKAA